MTQAKLINLHPNKYSQELHHYPFAMKLDKWVGSFNSFNNLSNKVCIPNKIEDLNLSVLNTITGINESKTLRKDLSYECKCEFDERSDLIQINIYIIINVDVNVKKVMYVKRSMFRILLQVIVKMENI